MKRILIAVAAVFLCAGAYLIASCDLAGNDASATDPSDQMTVAVNCTAPNVKAFAPDIDYTVGWNPPSRDSMTGSDCSLLSAELTNGVNGETEATDLGCSEGGGIVTVWHQILKMKLTGLQCSTFWYAGVYSQVSGSDGPVDVYMGKFNGSSWGTNKVDTRNETPVFAAMGLVGSSAVTDISDGDGQGDGEILIGASTDYWNGGGYQGVKFPFAGRSSWDSQAVTMIFRPGN